MGQYRKRMRRVEDGSARFLTFSCTNRFALLRKAEIRDVFVEELKRARGIGGFRLFAWVVMPDHVHLIVHPGVDGWDVVRITKTIKQSVAQRVIRRWRALDAPILDRISIGENRYRFWQAGGGFDRNVRSLDELRREIEYVHMNPVRRGLVELPEMWSWSSALWYSGVREGEIEIDLVA